MNVAFYLTDLEQFRQSSFPLEAFFIPADGCSDVLLYGLMHILSFTCLDAVRSFKEDLLLAGQKVARSFKEDLLIFFELGETNDLSQLRVESMMT